MDRMSETPAVTLEVKYEDGHSYPERWLKDPPGLFCPFCAHEDTWTEDSDGDYYVGPAILCAACGAHFYLPNSSGGEGKKSWQDEQRFAAIKETMK